MTCGKIKPEKFVPYSCYIKYGCLVLTSVHIFRGRRRCLTLQIITYRKREADRPGLWTKQLSKDSWQSSVIPIRAPSPDRQIRVETMEECVLCVTYRTRRALMIAWSLAENAVIKVSTYFIWCNFCKLNFIFSFLYVRII